MTSSYLPQCPNHAEPLEGIPFPIPQKGTGMCPVSGCSFDYEVELDQAVNVVDKNGTLTKKVGWQVNGEET